MPKIKIKANSITNLTDARYFAAMMVDYMGFLLDLSHDERLSPAEFHGIKAWVEGPKIVAQVGKTPASLLHEVYAADDFDAVTSAIDNADFADIEKIYQFSPANLHDLAHQEFSADHVYQLDLQQLDEHDLYQGALLPEICAKHRLFISAPSHESNIRKLIQDIQPYGIDLLGGAEEKVGFKSYEELDVFFEQFEIYA